MLRGSRRRGDPPKRAPAGEHSPCCPEPPRLFPVRIRGAGGEFDGYVDRLDESRVTIQALGPMPEAGGECAVTFYLEGGETRALGKVLGHDLERGQYGVELSQLDMNGRLLLAGLLLEEPHRPG